MLEISVLVVAGLAAGWINAIAGAGSLLTLPALIFTGLDPGTANATNRIAVLFQSVAALLAYRRGGVHAGGFVLAVSAPAVVAAVAGAWVATRLDDASLRVAIGIAMVVFLGLSFVRPGKRELRPTDPPAAAPAPAPAEPDGPPRVRPSMLVGFALIGFYAGFLQAGVGILVLFYLSLVHACRLVTANAVKVGLLSVLAAVSIATFIVAGQAIDPIRGGALAVGTVVGGYLGARAALSRGERFVRVALVAAVLASVAKLLYDAF